MPTALQFKEQGNQHYLAFSFMAAEESYSKGLEALDETNKNADSLKAVLYSNRGNSRFEQGNYDGAADDSKQSLWCLQAPAAAAAKDDADKQQQQQQQQLVAKNQSTRALAELFGKVVARRTTFATGCR